MTEQSAPEQPTPIEEIERGASFVQKHLIWVLGLIPLVFAGLRVIVASGGNAETLKALVQDLDITALVLASFLPFFGTALLCIFTFNLVLPNFRKNTNKLGWIFLTVVVASVVWTTMPLSYLLANTAVIFALFFIALTSHLTKSSHPAIEKFLVGLLTVAIVIVLISAPFVLAGVWLPKEQIFITGQSPTFGYVLSSDARWTKYMDTNEKIYIVSTNSVVDRRSVDDTHNWYHKTLSDLRG